MSNFKDYIIFIFRKIAIIFMNTDVRIFQIDNFIHHNISGFQFIFFEVHLVFHFLHYCIGIFLCFISYDCVEHWVPIYVCSVVDWHIATRECSIDESSSRLNSSFLAISVNVYSFTRTSFWDQIFAGHPLVEVSSHVAFHSGSFAC
ncbi:hypothetical protein O3G_MSEX014797 [Manduca sexta]|uniref:Uncharacterized protein n=1 Tax=Manduca sexta TaxID=7130 RepID=A0A921ZY61_MANSE|nr:hypothetical protein O3G_MSEX014797 [Manduca sexta]